MKWTSGAGAGRSPASGTYAPTRHPSRSPRPTGPGRRRAQPAATTGTRRTAVFDSSWPGCCRPRGSLIRFASRARSITRATSAGLVFTADTNTPCFRARWLPLLPHAAHNTAAGPPFLPARWPLAARPRANATTADHLTSLPRVCRLAHFAGMLHSA
jgi:hypothetical protein